MKRRFRRIAVIILTAILASLPVARKAEAAVDCPGNVTSGGTMACHLTTQSNDSGTYYCDDGNYYRVACKDIKPTAE